MLLPVAVGDYVDMYAGIHHATNLGRLFRPEGEPLLPNWRHIPVGYHGRAGTIAVSGTEVVRPWGHVAGAGGRRVGSRARSSTSSSSSRSSSASPSRRGEPVADRRRRRARVRHAARQRLVRPRHPGLRVPTARAVPREVVHDLGLAVARSPRRARAGARRGAGRPTQEPQPDAAPADGPAVDPRAAPRGRARDRRRCVRSAPRAGRPCPRSKSPTRSTGRPRSRSRTRRRTARRCAPATCSRPARSPVRDPRTQGGSFIELTWRGHAAARPAERRDAAGSWRTATGSCCEAGADPVRRGWVSASSTARGRRRHRTRRLTMPYYRHVGDVPAQAPLVRARRRRVPVRGADGSRGLRAGVVAAVPPALAERDRRSRSRRRAPVDDGPRSSAAPASPPHRRRRRRGATPSRDRTIAVRKRRRAHRLVRGDRPTSDLYRDATGDQLVYVQSGTGTLESSFGSLTVGPGDYVVIPSATTHRWRVGHSGPLTGLVLESAGHVRVPGKYLTDRGQFREGAPFSERDLRGARRPARVRRHRRARARAHARRTVAARARAPTRSTWSRGTAACGRSRSRSTTSSRSSALGTSHRRCTRRSRARVRRLLVRAAPLRLRRGRGEGPVPPCQRRLRRSALLLRRRLHEPGRQRHRHRLDLVPPGRLRARSATGQRRRLPRRDAHRRGRGDGRHLRAARAVGRGPEHLRSRTIRGRGRGGVARPKCSAQATASARTINEPPWRFAWYAAVSARRSSAVTSSIAVAIAPPTLTPTWMMRLPDRDRLAHGVDDTRAHGRDRLGVDALAQHDELVAARAARRRHPNA